MPRVTQNFSEIFRQVMFFIIKVGLVVIAVNALYFNIFHIMFNVFNLLEQINLDGVLHPPFIIPTGLLTKCGRKILIY